MNGIVKQGQGSRIEQGDTIRIQFRCAKNLEDFDSDAKVTLSTYDGTVSEILTLDRRVVKACVYDHLIGALVGSTIVVEDTCTGSPDHRYMEVWIEDILEKTSERTLVVERRIENNSSRRLVLNNQVKIRNCLLRFKLNENGWIGEFPEILRQPFEVLLIEVSRDYSTLTTPRYLSQSVDSPDSDFSVILTDETREILIKYIEGSSYS